MGKNYLNNNYYVAVADAATADADAGAEEATAVEDESSTPSESTDASDAPEGSEAAEPAGESESADAEAAEVPAGQEITIKQGVDVELFGRSLNQPYQVACLREDGALQLAGASCPSGTQAFTLSDLPPSERSAVGNLEAGSYDEVQSQLTKLSERALPKCRESTTDKDKFRSTPGIDCREVN